MLKKQYRLKKQGAFSATYRIKNSYFKSGVVLFVGKKKSDESYPTKVGFVVSKKTHKRAVKRNRLKRLMRESYRILQKEEKLGKSQKYMSLIFIGKEQALGLDFKKTKIIVENLLNRIKD